jgi:RNA exonuclease 1
VATLAQPPMKEVSKESIDHALSTANTHLATLFASLPKNTAIIIFSGHSDPRPMSQLTARKSRFELAINSGKPSTDLADDEKWTSQHVRELEDAVERAKRGLCFLGVKG